jgi:hypothetical protein
MGEWNAQGGANEPICTRGIEGCKPTENATILLVSLFCTSEASNQAEVSIKKMT